MPRTMELHLLASFIQYSTMNRDKPAVIGLGIYQQDLKNLLRPFKRDCRMTSLRGAGCQNAPVAHICSAIEECIRPINCATQNPIDLGLIKMPTDSHAQRPVVII